MDSLLQDILMVTELEKIRSSKKKKKKVEVIYLHVHLHGKNVPRVHLSKGHCLKKRILKNHALKLKSQTKPSNVLEHDFIQVFKKYLIMRKPTEYLKAITDYENLL